LVSDSNSRCPHHFSPQLTHSRHPSLRAVPRSVHHPTVFSFAPPRVSPSNSVRLEAFKVEIRQTTSNSRRRIRVCVPTCVLLHPPVLRAKCRVDPSPVLYHSFSY
jgi:hypothetical protein